MDSYSDSIDWQGRLTADLTRTFELVEAHPAAARFMTIATHSAPVPERLRQRPLVIRHEVLIQRELYELRHEPSRHHLRAGIEGHLPGEVPILVARSACMGAKSPMSDPYPSPRAPRERPPGQRFQLPPA